jgi:hypothetical protein
VFVVPISVFSVKYIHRIWFATFFAVSNCYFVPGLKDLELQLRSVKSDSTFDLVCKVGSLFNQIKFDAPSLPKCCEF